MDTFLIGHQSEYNGGGEKAEAAAEAKKKWIPLRPLTTSAIIRTAGESGGQFDARLRGADSQELRKMTDGAATPAGGENIKLK